MKKEKLISLVFQHLMVPHEKNDWDKSIYYCSRCQKISKGNNINSPPGCLGHFLWKKIKAQRINVPIGKARKELLLWLLKETSSGVFYCIPNAKIIIEKGGSHGNQ